MNKRFMTVLENAIQKNHPCCIWRQHIDDNPLYGFPVQLSDTFLLLEHEYDFQVDGFKLLRLCDIINVRHGPTERFCSTIFQKEAIAHEPFLCAFSPFDIYYNLFEQLKQRQQHISVECEGDAAFFLGRLLNVSRDCIELQCVDGVGRWEAAATTISYEAITCVSFQSRYIKMISKYARP